jgi:hypothetical protein
LDDLPAAADWPSSAPLGSPSDAPSGRGSGIAPVWLPGVGHLHATAGVATLPADAGDAEPSVGRVPGNGCRPVGGQVPERAARTQHAGETPQQGFHCHSEVMAAQRENNRLAQARYRCKQKVRPSGPHLKVVRDAHVCLGARLEWLVPSAGSVVEDAWRQPIIMARARCRGRADLQHSCGVCRWSASSLSDRSRELSKATPKLAQHCRDATPPSASSWTEDLQL